MIEYSDIIIIGAGLSGVGAACLFHRDCPSKSVVILESRETSGGTWDLFRYPGVRCDTDMYTLGYSFEPFPGHKSITDGADVLQYIRDTAKKYGVDRWIQYGRQVVRIEWSSPTKRWRVTTRLSGGEEQQYECSFLHCCSGYYRYDRAHRPRFPEEESFRGTLVHPQYWPKDLDYSGKNVVVVGSGATAITLAPNLAQKAASVVMLQRSPSYVASLPSEDPFDRALSRFMPRRWAYYLTRWKQIGVSMLIVNKSRGQPDKVRAMLRKHAVDVLGPDYPVDVNFNPRYNPFDQRVCFMPDGDLFRALRKKTVEIVTDTIERFTPTGIQLTGGRHLSADIVVTATGFELLPLAGLTPIVDGVEQRVKEAFVYKGMMLSGVPNFAFVVGYTDLPWTLKADMVNRYVSRLIRYMDRSGYRSCAPRSDDEAMGATPLMNISSGYAKRAADLLPRQGDRPPWKLYQHYLRDRLKLYGGKLADGVLSFS
jgi:monooxygenase